MEPCTQRGGAGAGAGWAAPAWGPAARRAQAPSMPGHDGEEGQDQPYQHWHAAARDAGCLAELAALTSSSRACGTCSAAEELENQERVRLERTFKITKPGHYPGPAVKAQRRGEGGLRGRDAFGWGREFSPQQLAWGCVADLCWCQPGQPGDARLVRSWGARPPPLTQGHPGAQDIVLSQRSRGGRRKGGVGVMAFVLPGHRSGSWGPALLGKLRTHLRREWRRNGFCFPC